jgi:hypothetical protein
MGLWWDTSGVIDDAYWAVVNQCMADEGFPSPYSYREIGDVTSTSGDAEGEQLDPWFGVSKAEWGAKYGYHEVPESALYTVEIIHGKPGPDGYEEALHGPRESRDASGCGGRADEVIYGGQLSREELGGIQREVERRVKTRARVSATVTAASAKWSACMAADGYQYADPHAAFDAFAPFVSIEGGEVPGYASNVPGDEERRVAQADGACKEQTGFGDAVQEATDAAELEVAADMRTDLEAVRRTHSRWVENATAIIAAQ